MQDVNYNANRVIEFLSSQFEMDDAKKQEMYIAILAILTEGEEGKPVGQATIVQEQTVAEQFPSHDETSASQ